MSESPTEDTMAERTDGSNAGPESAPSPAVSPNRKLLFVLVVFAILFMVAEVTVRCFSDVQLGFSYENGSFRKPMEYPRAETQNEHGFHDRPWRPVRPGVNRVVLLGDSYVAAKTVDISQTVGQRLEAHLNDGTSCEFEVISLGYNAWGQREELAALKEHGPVTQPAWVVTLFLVFNDVRNNSPALQMQSRDQQVRILQFRPDWVRFSADDAPFLMFRWSALNRLISHRLALLLSADRNDEIPLDYFVYKKPLDAEWEEAWEHTELLLDETRMQADRLGARFAIVSASTPHGVMGPEQGVRHLGAVYPKMRDARWDLDQPDERLAAYCRQRDIPFLRLEPKFRHETLSKGRTLHWRFDGHWNVEGNDLAGESIAHFLSDLDACARSE